MSVFTLNISAKATVTVSAATLREAINVVNYRYDIALKESRDGSYAFTWAERDGVEQPFELIEEDFV